jgi:hypothetical protein
MIEGDASISSRLSGDGLLGRDRVSLDSNPSGSAKDPTCRSPSPDGGGIECFDIFTRGLQGVRDSSAYFLMFAARG